MSRRDEPVACSATMTSTHLDDHEHTCSDADAATCARLRFHVCTECRRYFHG